MIVSHGRKTGRRAPLCETAGCQNLGTLPSKEWGNDGKWYVTVMRCDTCHPIARQLVEQMEAKERARRERDAMGQQLRKKALELGAAMLSAEEREIAEL